MDANDDGHHLLSSDDDDLDDEEEDPDGCHGPPEEADTQKKKMLERIELNFEAAQLSEDLSCNDETAPRPCDCQDGDRDVNNDAFTDPFECL